MARTFDVIMSRVEAILDDRDIYIIELEETIKTLEKKVEELRMGSIKSSNKMLGTMLSAAVDGKLDHLREIEDDS